jgi:DNA processing protein
MMEIPGLGRKRLKKVLNSGQENAESINNLLDRACEMGIIKAMPSEQTVKKAEDLASTIASQNARYGIKMMSCLNHNFPKCLLYEDGPVLIYYLGDISCLDLKKCVAVIGSRDPDQLGSRFAYNAAKEIALNGGVTVSGLAIGCDTAGHRGALSVKGKTVAFLPSGLLNIYPSVNQTLAHEILDSGGCLISEYSPKTEAHAYRFVERDRLQAAASQMIVTSSFAHNSGTLHTLKFADALSRPIYTIEEIVRGNPTGFRTLNSLGIAYSVKKFQEIVDLLTHL